MTHFLMTVALVLMLVSVIMLFRGANYVPKGQDGRDPKRNALASHRVLVIFVIAGTVLTVIGMGYSWALWLGIILIEGAGLCYLAQQRSRQPH